MKKRLISLSVCMLMVAVAFAGLTSADNWTHFGHDGGRSGSTTDTGPSTNTLLWSKGMGGDHRDYASPAIVDGRVYVPSAGEMYCFDAINGDLLWNTVLAGAHTKSSPAVYDGYVYVESGKQFFCLDALTGDIMWNYSDADVRSGVTPSPAVVLTNNPNLPVLVFFATWNGYIYQFEGYPEVSAMDDGVADPPGAAYDLITKKDASGSFSTGPLAAARSPAAQSGVYVIDGNSVREFDLISLNEGTGFSLGQDVQGCAPALVDVNDDSVIEYVYTTTDEYGVGGHHYCFWAHNHTLKWHALLTHRGSSFAVANGRYYVGTFYPDDPAKVYCLNANTGDVIWEHSLPTDWRAETLSRPAATSDNYLYIIVDDPYSDSSLFCFNIYGTQMWTYDFGKGVSSSPAIYDSKVYVNIGSAIYCIGDDTNLPPETPEIPDGPAEGDIDEQQLFDVEGVTDPDGHDVYYLIDWNDGFDTGWMGPYDSGENVTGVGHKWKSLGSFQVQVKAKDKYGKESGWSDPLVISIEDPTPLLVDTNGPYDGFANEAMFFTGSVSGGKPGYTYLWDFGDGNTSDEPNPKHTYDDTGEYTVLFTVTDDRGVSDNDTTTARIRHVGIELITGGFGVSAEIKNTLLVSKYFNWSVELVGGSVPGFHINKQHDGEVLVKANSTGLISTPPFFGLGRFKITVTVECTAEPAETKTVDGLLLFFYVIILE